MIFVTKMDIIPGKSEEAVKLVKTVAPPDEIKIINFYQMFGKPDFYLIFSAPDEDMAIDYVMNYQTALETSTSLGVPIDEI
ncbi:MAG: hypothetical protein SVK54_06790 [candidate division WOR-3 bacterium]|nr:hypothetical protein [candidate division WOR-3 bacterium]